MALERDGERIATYPDVITTLDAGRRSGERRTADRRDAGAHPARSEERIALSASVFDPSVYPAVERALGIEIARYALDGKRP